MNLAANSSAWISVGGGHGRGRVPALFSPASSLKLVVRPSRNLKTICFVMDELKEEAVISKPSAADPMARKQAERRAYLIAALMSSFGITSMAVGSVYYRFSWQMETGAVPAAEMLGTFSLSLGAAVGMEFWARWAHRALWHASLWEMHRSHHSPREGGPFELNDVFAIINAVPAISLLSYGFFNRGIVPGLCFGAGLGITLYGIAYMFVHDGLVHRRFHVGPIANVPYFRRVAAAHQIHHSGKFQGVPYGLFLGPKQEVVEALFIFLGGSKNWRTLVGPTSCRGRYRAGLKCKLNKVLLHNTHITPKNI